jgi:hypothetical protein
LRNPEEAGRWESRETTGFRKKILLFCAGYFSLKAGCLDFIDGFGVFPRWILSGFWKPKMIGLIVKKIAGSF